MYRDAHMSADGNLPCDRHDLGERIGRGVRDQFRQPTLKNVQTIDFGKIAAVAWLDQMLLAGRGDIAKYGFVTYEFGHIGDWHPQMLANCAQGSIDRLSGGFSWFAQRHRWQRESTHCRGPAYDCTLRREKPNPKMHLTRLTLPVRSQVR